MGRASPSATEGLSAGRVTGLVAGTPRRRGGGISSAGDAVQDMAEQGDGRTLSQGGGHVKHRHRLQPLQADGWSMAVGFGQD